MNNTNYTIKSLNGHYFREQYRSADNSNLQETLLAAANYIGYNDVVVDDNTDPDNICVYTRSAWESLDPGTAANSNNAPILICFPNNHG